MNIFCREDPIQSISRIVGDELIKIERSCDLTHKNGLKKKIEFHAVKINTLIKLSSSSSSSSSAQL